LLFAFFVNIPEKCCQIILEKLIIPQLVKDPAQNIMRWIGFSGNNKIIPRDGKMNISNETI
jgi:hypothetical protein